jgi:hypothetical protein
MCLLSSFDLSKWITDLRSHFVNIKVFRQVVSLKTLTSTSKRSRRIAIVKISVTKPSLRVISSVVAF